MALLSCFCTGFAQFGSDMMGSMRSSMISPAMLLVQKDFRNELKITGAQAKKIDPILKDHQKEMEAIQKENSNPATANIGGVIGRMQKKRRANGDGDQSRTHSRAMGAFSPDPASDSQLSGLL